MTNVTCSKCNSVHPEGTLLCSRCGSSLPQASRRSAPQQGQGVLFRKGQVVAGRYTVLDMLGRGGMGCIYRVHDNTLNEEVALKTLLPQFARDKLVVERFYNEARIARQLSHPNIVRVHDIGVAENLLYISMEIVRGKSLRTILDELPAGSRLPIKTTLRIMDEVCEALKYAHQYTIHRDIKPENIMLTTEGKVKLMDFGISKLVANPRLTAASVVMGTPLYMSPEQLRDSSRVDARADIFSVGVVLYEILTNNLPTGVPRPASQLTRDMPPVIDPILTKCLEPNPDDRFQCAEDLQTALRPIRAAIESGTDIADPHPLTTRARSPWGRKAAGVGLALIILIAGGFGVYVLDRDRRNAVERAAVAERDATEAAPSVEETEFDALGTRIVSARNRALVRMGSEPAWRPVLAQGDALWKFAQQQHEAGTADALHQAWRALQHYLAILIQPEGMIFVPPDKAEIVDATGRSTVVTEGFFIERTEVSRGEFERFAQGVAGGWPLPASLSADLRLPMTNVTYYDAQAYAGWRGRRLPTEAQWARAAAAMPLASEDAAEDDAKAGRAASAVPAQDAASADYRAILPVGDRKSDLTPLGICDMNGNAAEWTRTLYAQPGSPTVGTRPDFGSLLVVRGGSAVNMPSYPLAARSYERFEQRRPDLGFRCVFDLPNDLASVDALLNR
ncbi:MAG TPA: bifunctional serine/threonine-protein kinase/formylglycine-generating enzyme family protein [Candidatus Hydrogenedentes bacterium]|nr:bifunctional serine/threonine-protein kinase/formylglycine-generating enzyme family protein [Candidatus Hydrogenedentota bacterium]